MSFFQVPRIGVPGFRGRQFVIGFRAGLATLAVALLLGACGGGPVHTPAPIFDRSGALGRTDSATGSSPTSAPRRTDTKKAQAELPEADGRVVRSRSRVVRVRSGDTLYSIAQRQNVPLRALIEANRVRPPYRLLPGQRIQIPEVRVYEVVRGDTVYAIGRRFDLSPGGIIRQNDLKAPDFRLVPGQRLVLPWSGQGTPDRQDRIAAKTRSEAPEKPSRGKEGIVQPPPVQDAAAVRSAVIKAPPPRAESRFLWPLQGRILSGYGEKGAGRFNDGINIEAPAGAPVRAAENGVVVYAGNELAGYGNLLLIRHDDGWVSAYAHTRDLLVRRGDTVKRGQLVARVGKTGNVTRPQLHFELRKGRRAVDPVRHLAATS